MRYPVSHLLEVIGDQVEDEMSMVSSPFASKRPLTSLSLSQNLVSYSSRGEIFRVSSTLPFSAKPFNLSTIFFNPRVATHPPSQCQTFHIGSSLHRNFRNFQSCVFQSFKISYIRSCAFESMWKRRSFLGLAWQEDHSISAVFLDNFTRIRVTTITSQGCK